jgi:hypothetical protein
MFEPLIPMFPHPQKKSPIWFGFQFSFTFIIQNFAQHEIPTWVVLGFVQVICRAQDKKRLFARQSPNAMGFTP